MVGWGEYPIIVNPFDNNLKHGRYFAVDRSYRWIFNSYRFSMGEFLDSRTPSFGEHEELYSILDSLSLNYDMFSAKSFEYSKAFYIENLAKQFENLIEDKLNSTARPGIFELPVAIYWEIKMVIKQWLTKSY